MRITFLTPTRAPTEHSGPTVETHLMLTHPCPPGWIASTGSRRRWRWRLWWTLCRTVSPRSPSVASTCPSGPPSHSGTRRRHTPRPRPGSTSRAWSLQTNGARRPVCAAQEGQAGLHLGWGQGFKSCELTGSFLPVRRVLVNAGVVKDALGQSCVAGEASVPSLNRVPASLTNPCVQPPSLLSSLPHTRHLDWWQWRACTLFLYCNNIRGLLYCEMQVCTLLMQ